MQKMQQKQKNIFNRLVRCLEFKIISIRLEIRNQHVEMHQIPSMEEKSATSSAKPVSLPCSSVSDRRPLRPQIKRSNPWTRAHDELKLHQTALKKAEQKTGESGSDSGSDSEPEPEPEPEPVGQPPSKRRRRAFEPPDEDGTVEVKDCSIVVQKVENDKQVSPVTLRTYSGVPRRVGGRWRLRMGGSAALPC